MVKNTVTGRVRSERGAAAVEFALVLPVLLLVVAGAVEFGRAFWFYDALSKATRDATRYISITNCYSGETQTDCQARLGNVVNNAKVMVTTAATESHLTNFGDGNVYVLCDGLASKCNDLTDPTKARPEYVTVGIGNNIGNNYSIRLGEWLPLGYLGEAVGYNLGIQPHTTMRYMGG